MILAIDIGNTNIVLGVVRGEEILHEARMATDPVKTSDQYRIDLKNMLSLFDVTVDQIEGAIISSVVPPVLNSFTTAIKKLTGKDCMIVGPGIKTGLNILMDSPRQVGSDLIAAAVSAIRKYGAPLLVIDMGTATTITAINERQEFVGGCICPGVKTALEALTSRTAQLPGISLAEPQHAIGRNTVDSMLSGAMYGAAAMLDGLIDRMEEELGSSATVIATGGVSRFVIPLCRRNIIYDRDLLLHGLVFLYYKNHRS